MGISIRQAQVLMEKQGKTLPGPRTNCRKTIKGMNKLEKSFAHELEIWKAAGEILEYFHEHLTQSNTLSSF